MQNDKQQRHTGADGTNVPLLIYFAESPTRNRMSLSIVELLPLLKITLYRCSPFSSPVVLSASVARPFSSNVNAPMYSPSIYAQAVQTSFAAPDRLLNMPE